MSLICYKKHKNIDGLYYCEVCFKEWQVAQPALVPYTPPKPVQKVTDLKGSFNIKKGLITLTGISEGMGHNLHINPFFVPCFQYDKEYEVNVTVTLTEVEK